MSTGFECSFIEPKPGQWYYVLQNWDCPVGAWDWREYATAYGPFPSQERAEQHLSDTQPNPGGYSICNHDRYKPDEVYERLIEQATQRRKTGTARRFPYPSRWR